MARKIKSKAPKAIDNVEYKKELHHTCNNSAICKVKVHPDETCKDCAHYKLLEVDVALVPQRDEVDWGF